MENEKVLTLLGFARKAGKLSAGSAASREAVLKGKAALVLVCEDISAKSLKETAFTCEKVGVQCVKIPINSSDVTAAIGTKAGIASINDEGFASAILKNLQ